jgi:opacity protein-like surface antigen
VKKFGFPAAMLAFAMLAVAGTANAQVATILKPVQIGVALGGAFPLSDFGKSFNTGYNFTGTIGLNPVGMPVGFRIDAAYNQFSAKGTTTTNAKIASVSGNVVYSMPGVEITPYLIGGVGYYHVSATVAASSAVAMNVGFDMSGGLNIPSPRFATAATTSTASAASNHVGFNAGGGLKIPLTGFTAFIEARYNRISENGGSTSFVPVTVGVMF